MITYTRRRNSSSKCMVDYVGGIYAQKYIGHREAIGTIALGQVLLVLDHRIPLTRIAIMVHL